MSYPTTAIDKELARSVVDGIGVSCWFAAEGAAPIMVQAQWVAGSRNAGQDDFLGIDGGTFNQYAGPWEAAVIAYVCMEDVPSPRQGALMWLDDQAQYRYEVDGAPVPQGALWRLALTPV